MTPQEDPQIQALMEQLNPIFTPSPVGFWPLPIGLAALAAGGLAVLIGVALFMLRRYRATAYKRQALKLLKLSEPAPTQQYAQFVNSVLKRVALTAYPTQKARINPLFGEQWLEFLNQINPKFHFTDSIKTALSNAPYQANCVYEPQQLQNEALLWLKSLRPVTGFKGANHV